MPRDAEWRPTNVTRNDPRSDVYAAGATFFFLLAGRVPFETRSMAEATPVTMFC